jgi:hypothetical protein
MAPEGRRLRPARLNLRELSRLVVPGLAAAGLLFALPGDGGSQGEPKGASTKSEPAPLCGEWHRGAGETTALDLGEIRRAHADLKSRVARSLDRAGGAPPLDLARPYDAGLPACREEAVRLESLSPAQGSRFRGRTLYFRSASDLARLSLPPEVGRIPEAEILIVQARSLKDLPEIAHRLGRPVSLASASFARALGVRCANTWLRISEKGDGIELHESR